jgi:hypothetical protein
MRSKPASRKSIPGYEGLYSVTHGGEIISHGKYVTSKNVRWQPESILKPLTDVYGYNNVCLCNGSGQVKKYRVHKLVALAYLPNPDKHPIINHKNGVKTDNCIENLEWCTHSHNNKHAFRVLGRQATNKGVFGSDHPCAKTVAQVSRDDKIIMVHPSVVDASKITGVPKKNISNAALGRKKSAGGYVWRYV